MNRILLFICIASFFSCEREKLSWDKEKIVPKLSGCVVSNITANSAYLGSKILNNGGLDITEFGFFFSEGDSLHYYKEYISSRTSIDWQVFGSLNGLKEGTKYYVKAYAINATGIGYGEAMPFTTKLLPVVVTDTFTYVTQNSVQLWGAVLFDGGAQINERGICASAVSSLPSIGNGNNYMCGVGVGSFSTGQITLTPKVTYYYRAYANSGNGVVYGKVKTLLLK